jgi:ABC-type tungstate transport system permease subunit
MFNFDSSDEDPDLDELDNPPFETTIIEEDQNFLNFYDFIKLNKKKIKNQVFI